MKPDCAHEPDTHCIHSSERRAYRSCRRRWDWSFRHHYTPPQTHKALEFGIAFHSAMEQIYEPELWDESSDEDKLKKSIKVFEEITWEQRKKFLVNSRQTLTNKPFGDDYEERIVLGKGMLTHYVRNVHPDADRFFRPVRVEVPFACPLANPNNDEEPLTCEMSPLCGQDHPNPAPVTLNGRVDALFEDIVNGGYYIVDWKTAATLLSDGEHLQLDDQITSYCAALSLVLGIDVRGFLYAEIRKDYPRPPKRNERQTKGRIFSVAANQATTYELAEKTIREQDSAAYKAGFYDEYLEKLRKDPPKFHQRFPVIQSEAKLRNTLQNVSMEAMELTDPDLLIYPAPSKMNCSGCAFKSPCLGKFNDEDYLYTLKTMFGTKSGD